MYLLTASITELGKDEAWFWGSEPRLVFYLVEEKKKIDLEKMDGMTGVCSLITKEGSKGGEFNSVQYFYPPSKTPAVTANDEAWKKRGGFMEVSDDFDPFDI